MKSDYRGYTIIHDRNRAQAWKGEIDPSRQPIVDVTSGIESALSQAMQVIDAIEAYEAGLDAAAGL